MSMKLEVNVVTTHLGKSPVIVDGNVVSVSGLPEGLCAKMMCLLKMMEHEAITTIFFAIVENDEHILLVKRDGENCTPEVVADVGVRNYLEETIELLSWYFKDHFCSAEPGLLGSLFRCTDCGRQQEQPFDPGKCQNFECSSHKKMGDIDPAYVATTQEGDPVASRIRKMNDEIVSCVQPLNLH